MSGYRSRTTTTDATWQARAPSGAANGMTGPIFEKPIIAIVNSFTQFVPGMSTCTTLASA